MYKKFLWKFASISFATVLLVGQVPFPIAQAGISEWQKGASISPRWSEDFASQSFKDSVANLKRTNANTVILIIPWYQSNRWSTDIHSGWNTPTDASLISAIQYIHSQGMRVILKPHLDSYDGVWRANIDPGDREGWYRNYTGRLTQLADIAKAHNAYGMVVGTELVSMASDLVHGDNGARWQAIIAAVRSRYGGFLIYSANWGSGSFADEKNHITFWSSLDAVGISAYFELHTDGSVNSLKQAWSSIYQNDIRPLQSRWGKPIIFTEVGYKNVTGAHTQPWNPSYGGPNDQIEQANDYEALFSFWNGIPEFIGVYLWDWSSDPNAGGAGDTGYTPQHKQAEQVMTQWFGSVPSGGTPPPPSGTPSFSDSTSVNPSNPSVNQATGINAAVRNSGEAASGVVVDIEIYDSSGSKVFQRFYENETLGSGASKNYSASFTPSAGGNYTVKVGVFASGWSRVLFWNDTAATISVGGSSPPPLTSASMIDTWWPTQNSTISGTQPFKAIATNADISQYQMFWQVDGDVLNGMYNSDVDYPHKEAIVDVSGWSWKGAGPYAINFVAKNNGGGLIAERVIQVTIAR